MSKTDYLETKILEHIVGKTAYTMPSVWVGLFTAAPSDAGGGTEATGGGYARKATVAADWAAAVSGSPSSIANAVAIEFAAATGGGYGPVTHWGLFDAVTGGNLLRWAILGTAKTFTLGDIPRYAAGALTLTED